MARRKVFTEFKSLEEERIINDINKQYKKKNIVLYLVAHRGVGKTSICKKINKNYLIYNVSSFTKDDLLNGKWYSELLKLSKKCEDETCLLVFDDFDEFDVTMHEYVYDLLDKEKHIGNLIIPDNVNVLLCGNMEEYSNPLNILDFKLYSKIKKYEFKPGIIDYLAWANKNKINNVVKSYLNENPTDLIRDIKDNDYDYDYMYSLTPKNWSIRISNEINISNLLKVDFNLDYYLDSKTKEKFMEYYERYINTGIYDILNGKYDNVNDSDISFITNALGASAYTLKELKNVLSFYNYINNKEYKDLFVNIWSSINRTKEDDDKLKEALRGDKSEK